jgi:hypothetical protein
MQPFFFSSNFIEQIKFHCILPLVRFLADTHRVRSPKPTTTFRHPKRNQGRQRVRTSSLRHARPLARTADLQSASQ